MLQKHHFHLDDDVNVGQQDGSVGADFDNSNAVGYVPDSAAILNEIFGGFSYPNENSDPNIIAHDGSEAGDTPDLSLLPASFTGALPIGGESSSAGASIAESSIGADGATAAQLRQALDDSGLSLTGAGIKVGVLSDSFDDLGGAAQDEADGALPPNSDIQVLEDLPSGGTDEGRAMMEIVHDIAPDASMAFYTAYESEQDFANGILALAADGCKVICDDVSYFDEPFFQNDVVAEAIQTVEAEGVSYITAAGNDASNGYQAAWTPISGQYHGTTLTDAKALAAASCKPSRSTPKDRRRYPPFATVEPSLRQATSDLEMLVFNSRGRLVGTATNATNGEPNNPYVEYDFTRTGHLLRCHRKSVRAQSRADQRNR